MSKNGEYLALGGSDGLIEVWNFKTMKLDTERLLYQSEGRFMVHHCSILALDFSLDERILASGDKSGTIQVWKVSDGKLLRKINIELSGNMASITCVKINP